MHLIDVLQALRQGHVASSCCLGASAVSASLSAWYPASVPWPGVGSICRGCVSWWCRHQAVPCRQSTACAACIAKGSTLWRHAANTRAGFNSWILFREHNRACFLVHNVSGRLFAPQMAVCCPALLATHRTQVDGMQGGAARFVRQQCQLAQGLCSLEMTVRCVLRCNA